MSIVFSILLMAAIVGIFRPYKFLPWSKRWQYGLAAFICFMAIGMTAPDNSGHEAQSVSKEATPPENTKVGERPKEETPKTKWVYNSHKDEMRDAVSKSATVQSENTIKFGFPYGEQRSNLTVRQDPKHGFDVMFSVPRGQILCRSYRRSHFNIKVDDGPIRKFNCTGASAGNSEVSFFTSPKQFLSSLKASQKIILEAEFYKAGRQQYVFDTSGLIWEN